MSAGLNSDAEEQEASKTVVFVRDLKAAELSCFTLEPICSKRSPVSFANISGASVSSPLSKRKLSDAAMLPVESASRLCAVGEKSVEVIKSSICLYITLIDNQYEGTKAFLRQFSPLVFWLKITERDLGTGEIVF
jgi:hypothetical protein